MSMPEPESVISSLNCPSELSELMDGDLIAIDVLVDDKNESVIFYREGEKFRAWLNVCPHAGRRLDYAPGKFLREHGRLVCAAHGAVFRLDDGVCIAGPCRGARLHAVPLSTNQEN